MQVQSVAPAPRRRRGVFGWFVLLVALLEVAAAVLLALLMRNGACPGVASAGDVVRVVLGPRVAGRLPAGAFPQGPLGGDAPAAAQPAASGPVTAPQPGAAQAAPTDGDTSATTANGAPNVAVSGDLNDVPDPDCVAKSAASLLTSDTPAPGAPAPAPSCGALKAPPALRDAAKTVQGLGTTPSR